MTTPHALAARVNGSVSARPMSCRCADTVNRARFTETVGATATAERDARARAVHSDAKVVANRDFRDFGWELYTMVPRTGGYAYGVGVWDLSIIQGPFSVAPCQTLAYVAIRNFCIAVMCASSARRRRHLVGESGNGAVVHGIHLRALCGVDVEHGGHQCHQRLRVLRRLSRSPAPKRELSGGRPPPL